MKKRNKLLKDDGSNVLNWTDEQKVLLNIKKIIADSWRMNSKQMSEYRGRLFRCQDRILPGKLGRAFLDAYDLILAGKSNIKWSDLLKDAECMLALIQNHQQCDQKIWIGFLSRLEAEAQQKRFFRTELGSAFVQTLKLKMGINADENRKQRISEQAIKKISQKNSVNDKAELEKVAQWLMSDIRELKVEGKKRSHFQKLFERAVVPVFACLSLCFLFIWLHGLIGQNQNRWDIQQMKTVAFEKAETLKKADVGTKVKAINKKENVSIAVLPTEGQHKKEKLILESKPDILPQYREISQKYPDLYGWLEIPGMEIDMPVMRSEENRDFYLHHDFTGAESAEGALFVDQKNADYPQDDNTVVYGHNMKNGHMFGRLKRYEDEDFFQSHKEIHFDTLYETGTYEVVAVLRTRILNENEEGFRYYQFFNCENEESFQKCLDFIAENRIFEIRPTLQYGDRILMLSTCEYSQENGRLVVIAKQLKR